MTGNNEFGRHALIETAMNRAGTQAALTGERPTDPNAIWREEQVRALKARQAQLESARSESEQKRSARLGATVGRESGPPSRFARLLVMAAMALTALGVGVWWGATGAIEPSAPLPAPKALTLPIQEEPVAPPSAVADAPSPSPVESREALARSLVERWRQAWTQRDVDVYLASYAPSFTPPKGQNRAQWEAARRDNLSSRASIEVAIDELRTEPVGEQQLAVHFLQDYTSPTYREKAQPKTLLLEQVDGQWRIAGEWSGAFQKVSARPE